ncbi:Alpha/Beta hydrolase protein [Podospora didyma]|uniref:Alpha/Beta hydrolase protein n=1 Tax=Podospora didyma TaxID=330526 RepID=A0AAE0TW46_9PEZI|nr:Alpha/Beta hydrolase protein [Podospora didyma]
MDQEPRNRPPPLSSVPGPGSVFMYWTIPWATDIDRTACTWYQVYGNIKESQHPVLIRVHGGPGMGRRYLARPFLKLHEKFGIPLVLSDQVSCGKSNTMVAERAGNKDWWHIRQFITELHFLISYLKLQSQALHGFVVYGHGWGGLIATGFAQSPIENCKGLIIAHTPTDKPLYAADLQKMTKRMPRETFAPNLDINDICQAVFDGDLLNANDDRAVYNAMWGMMSPKGQIFLDGAHPNLNLEIYADEIDAQTLLITGKCDWTRDASFEPWFRYCRNIMWIAFRESGHMSFYEEQEGYIDLVGHFITGEHYQLLDERVPSKSEEKAKGFQALKDFFKLKSGGKGEGENGAVPEIQDLKLFDTHFGT